MSNDKRRGALDWLLRLAILGITQGVATLVAVIMFLAGCGADLIVAAVLCFALAGLVGGARFTRPTA